MNVNEQNEKDFRVILAGRDLCTIHHHRPEHGCLDLCYISNSLTPLYTSHCLSAAARDSGRIHEKNRKWRYVTCETDICWFPMFLWAIYFPSSIASIFIHHAMRFPFLWFMRGFLRAFEFSMWEDLSPEGRDIFNLKIFQFQADIRHRLTLSRNRSPTHNTTSVWAD